MRNFEYKELSTKLLTPAIVKQLLEIHEHKGRQEQYLAAPSKLLSFLLKIAVIQSTRSSNRIEGIVAADRRLKEIVKMDTAPVNRSESEIAGYRKALSLIHESYEYIEPKPGVILQLHRILYSFLTNEGGSWKNSDNIIEEKMRRVSATFVLLPYQLSRHRKPWNRCVRPSHLPGMIRRLISCC